MGFYSYPRARYFVRSSVDSIYRVTTLAKLVPVILARGISALFAVSRRERLVPRRERKFSHSRRRLDSPVDTM